MAIDSLIYTLRIYYVRMCTHTLHNGGKSSTFIVFTYIYIVGLRATSQWHQYTRIRKDKPRYTFIDMYIQDYDHILGFILYQSPAK